MRAARHLGLLIGLLVTAPLSAATGSGVVFAGYLGTADGAYRFVLSEQGTGIASPWLTPGQAFAGVTILAFARERDVLVVARAGRTFELPLKGSKVLPGGSAAAAGKAVVSLVLLEDGSVLVQNQRMPLHALAGYLQALPPAGTSGAPMLSVLVQPGRDAQTTAAFRQQLLRALPVTGVVKVQGFPPPSSPPSGEPQP